MGENSRVMHFGRSFHDTRLEDDCPCAKTPCGLVSDDNINPACLQHPYNRIKTIRQRHYADDCPARFWPIPERDAEGVVKNVKALAAIRVATGKMYSAGPTYEQLFDAVRAVKDILDKVVWPEGIA